MVNTRKVTDQRTVINGAYYGDGGTGKTTALAAMANLGPVLYVDAEAGVKRQPLERLGINTDNIELLDVPSMSFTQLEDAYWEVKAELDADPDSWAGIVWDSGTEIYQAFLGHAVDRRVEKATSARAKGGNIADMLTDRFFTDRDDYGYMSSQMRHLLRRYRDLPCHFGIAFLERRDTDPTTGKVRIGPAVTPGLQNDIIGFVDLLCHTTVSLDGQYLGEFRAAGVRVAKDRYGVMPMPTVDPTWDRVVGYVNGELDEATDPVQAALEPEGEVTPETKPSNTAADLVAARRSRKAPAKAKA